MPQVFLSFKFYFITLTWCLPEWSTYLRDFFLNCRAPGMRTLSADFVWPGFIWIESIRLAEVANPFNPWLKWLPRNWINSTQTQTFFFKKIFASSRDPSEKHTILNRFIFKYEMYACLALVRTFCTQTVSSELHLFELWIILLKWCFIQLTTQVDFKGSESIQIVTQAFSTEIDLIQPTQTAYENIYWNQLWLERKTNWFESPRE